MAFISCVVNSWWVSIGLGNGLVMQAADHYMSQWWPILILIMSSNVFKLGDGLVLVWVMTWCCWRQALDEPLMTHPDSKIHGANMGPTWVLSAPDGPHEPCYQGILCCHVTWLGYNELTMTFICFKSFLPGSIVQILGDIVLEYCFIKLYMIFSISMKMLYTTSVKVDFIPPIMCSNEQMFHIHLSWLLALIALLHKCIHFDHYLVPGTFLIWYGVFWCVLVSVITIVMCVFKFTIYDNGITVTP